MKLELDASTLYDLVKNHDSVDLSFTSLEALLDYYDELDKNIEYDVSLFWGWEEYGSLEEAYRQKVKEGYFETGNTCARKLPALHG